MRSIGNDREHSNEVTSDLRFGDGKCSNVNASILSASILSGGVGMSGLKVFMTIVGLIGFASTLLAAGPRGSIVLDGQGSAERAPEFVSLAVRVTSLCYETSREAGDANAELANRVLAVFQGFKASDRDKVTATGGANVRQTETIYTGSTPTVLCQMKWHAENVISIRMANMASLTDLQDQMVMALAGLSSDEVRGAAETYGDVDRPEFGLSPETSRKLRIEAQAAAYLDARAQYDGLVSLCSFKNPRVVSIAPPSFEPGWKMAGDGIFRAGAATPVIPDSMAVQATLKVQWEFTPSTQCLEFQ